MGSAIVARRIAIGLLILLIAFPANAQRRRMRGGTAGGVESGGTCSPADFTYVGVVTAPDNYTIASGGGITGKTVAGVVHLYLYAGQSVQVRYGTISAVTSATEFSINDLAGVGNNPAVNDWINIGKAAGTDVVESVKITAVTGSGTGPLALTVSPALSATPKLATATTIASSASSTVMTVQAGAGANFGVGDNVFVQPPAGDTYESTTITNIATDTITVSPALSAAPGAGKNFQRNMMMAWIPEAGVIQVTVPTSGITTDYTTTSAMSLVAYWKNPYRGKNVSWQGGALPNLSQPNPGNPSLLPAGMYRDPTSGLLYFTFYSGYNTNGTSEWALMAATLNSADVDDVTAYGPWRIRATDVDGRNWDGGWRFGYLAGKHPTTGQLLGGGLSRSGAASNAFGPSLFGAPMPGTGTAGGYAASNVDATNRYLNYHLTTYEPTYNPTNYINKDGSYNGSLRAFQFNYPAGYQYIWEPDFDTPRDHIRPSLYGGVGSWIPDTAGVSGAMWLTGNKPCVIFSGSAPLSTNTDTESTSAAHAWYLSTGQGSLHLSGVTGTFTDGEVVTCSVSGGTISQTTYTAAAGVGPKIQGGVVEGGPHCAAGQTATGGQSGATGTVTVYHRHNVCYHGHAPAGTTVGPVFTYNTGFLWFFDPARLETNAALSTTDWATLMSSAVDVKVTLGMTLAAPGSPGQGNISLGYCDPTAKRLYLSALNADLSISSSSPQALIHILQLSADVDCPPQ